MNPTPDRQCSNCNSLRVVERERWSKNKTFIVLYTYCHSCRQEIFLWSGTRGQYTALRKKQSFVKRKMEYAARLAEQAGRRIRP